MSNSVQLEKDGYKSLVMEIKKELPNIVLPLMGLEDIKGVVDIDGKDFIISNKEESNDEVK